MGGLWRGTETRPTMWMAGHGELALQFSRMSFVSCYARCSFKNLPVNDLRAFAMSSGVPCAKT